ncbi:hypothetical protein OS493_013081 [Desmophyllum pertusum]|uniref:Transmembrane protein n=1 Tax=Desmophyllum pertusum TaxID=174260 RepID=A0A9W9YPV6_9CNID|nr:hypothetical protein OS493_013081 [Desmophyllum pertusum]
MERDDQIQRYLISSEPPYDNYYNISKAVYPSVALPSLLIDITVTFLAASPNNTNVPQSGGTASLNINSTQNGSDFRSTAANITRKYKWSVSCLYVSGGISLSAMNIFSLWAIWPNRRERKLHITLPQFCSGSPSDFPQNDTMIYFLSTLQDIAVGPSLPDPRINTAECVITGHNKASSFSGSKQLLRQVCWSLLFISLVMSMFASQWTIVQLQKWDCRKRDGTVENGNGTVENGNGTVGNGTIAKLLQSCRFHGICAVGGVLIVVAQVFLSESLISTIVQNGLVLVVTYWFGYVSKRDVEGGGGDAAAAAAAAAAVLELLQQQLQRQQQQEEEQEERV